MKLMIDQLIKSEIKKGNNKIAEQYLKQMKKFNAEDKKVSQEADYKRCSERYSYLINIVNFDSTGIIKKEIHQLQKKLSVLRKATNKDQNLFSDIQELF